MIRLSVNLPSQTLPRSSVVGTFDIPLPFQLAEGKKILKHTFLLPDVVRSLNFQKGNKISRLFRPIFEHKSIKKFFGTNLALMIFVASFSPLSISNKITDHEEVNVTTVPLILTTEKSVQNPLVNIKISQGYTFYHPAIDLDGITGEPIYPISKGKVKEVNYQRFGYGNSVLIDHDNEVTSFYAHLSRIEVEKDQEVTKETIIGKVGSTGFSTGDHLHLEIHYSGHPINPLTVLPTH
jgi:murein DD-endopeptidase MepM/ murein hydrolase activator NlpD